ncbi:MAG: LCP family protein [Candidatus Peribacteraceae bacterium]|nr:LCP family protein [Candidatus Peribacteraceae bacterium]
MIIMPREWIRMTAVWLVTLACAFALPIAAVGATGAVSSLAGELFASITGTLAPRDADGRTNVLLLGVGDSEHTAADLTDAIVVASMEPTSRSLVLFSIPRDLYLTDSTRMAPGKINGLYSIRKRAHRKEGLTATGASLLAMRDFADELEERLDIPIHGVMKMDFIGFERMIDMVGGVDVTVPKTITDDTYPVEEGELGVFAIEAGQQHLDGKTALRYARSRHSTSDFDRSARQQQILSALMAKTRPRDVMESVHLFDGILDALRGHVEWTFLPSDLWGLAGTAAGIDRDRIITMHLSTKTGGDRSEAAPGGLVYPPPPGVAGSGSVLLPVSLTDDVSDWGQIRSLASLLFSHRDLYLTRPTVTITHAPKAKIQAQRLRNELLRYGFTVAKAEKGPESLDMLSFLNVRGGSPSSARLAAQLSGVPFSWRSDVRSASGTEIRFSLGEEYRFVPFERRLFPQS